MDDRWSLSEFLARYERALARLEGLGASVQNTRLSRYEKQIRQGVEQELRGDLSHQATEPFINALVEAFDIIAIAQLPAEIFKDADSLRKLKNVPSGPDTMVPNQQDSARDDALEVVAAAMLHKNGVQVRFSASGGDLVVGENDWPVECKRISSLKSLEGRLRKARAQLEKQVAQGSPPGIIFIDLTNPIRHQHGAIHVQADETLNETADERLFAYMTHALGLKLQDVLRGAAVLGVVFRYWSHGTAGGVANIRVAPSFQLLSNHDSGAAGHAEFIRAVKGFGDGEILDATDKDVAKALKILAQRRIRSP